MGYSIDNRPINLIWVQLLLSGLNQTSLRAEISSRYQTDSRTAHCQPSLFYSIDGTRVMIKVVATPSWADTVAVSIGDKILGVYTDKLRTYLACKSTAFTSAAPYTLTNVMAGGVLNGVGQSDPTGKTVVSTRSITGDRVACVLSLGQSLASNTIYGGNYTPTATKVHNLSIHDGIIYDAVDPLLGCNQTRSNFLSRTLNKIRVDGYCDRAIGVPIAVGGTSVAQWANGGDCNHRIRVACARVLASGLIPTHILWEQGQRDTDLGTSQSSYQASLLDVIATFRSLGITAPFYVARSSYTAGVTSSAIIAAQNAVIGSSPTVLAGPDSDSYGAAYRTTDNVHLDQAGGILYANDWANIIKTWPI